MIPLSSSTLRFLCTSPERLEKSKGVWKAASFQFSCFVCHRKVGENVATLIPNGATLQMGIGSIPDAVLSALKGHKHLGIHSEMFSDGVVDLVESGAIDGSMKSRESFQIVGSFVVGSKRLVDFIDDNPSVKLLRSSYVNDPHVIREHEKMHAINSLVQIDLTGQVCADSIGTRIWSGIGGQMDFVRGASLRWIC